MRTGFGSETAVGRWAVDELFERYISWREESDAVQLAYQRWVDSTQGESWVAYGAYVAALDREEQAARTYADHIERFRWISDQPKIASTAA